MRRDHGKGSASETLAVRGCRWLSNVASSRNVYTPSVALDLVEEGE